jgi:hypothetical protein
VSDVRAFADGVVLDELVEQHAERAGCGEVQRCVHALEAIADR